MICNTCTAIKSGSSGADSPWVKVKGLLLKLELPTT